MIDITDVDSGRRAEIAREQLQRVRILRQTCQPRYRRYYDRQAAMWVRVLERSREPLVSRPTCMYRFAV